MGKKKPSRSWLREQIADEAMRREVVQRERDELLERLADEHAWLRAHRADLDRAIEQRDEARAEVERLSAALRTIRRMRPSVNGQGGERARQIAIEVLG